MIDQPTPPVLRRKTDRNSNARLTPPTQTIYKVQNRDVHLLNLPGQRTKFIAFDNSLIGMGTYGAGTTELAAIQQLKSRMELTKAASEIAIKVKELQIAIADAASTVAELDQNLIALHDYFETIKPKDTK